MKKEILRAILRLQASAMLANGRDSISWLVDYHGQVNLLNISVHLKEDTKPFMDEYLWVAGALCDVETVLQRIGHYISYAAISLDEEEIDYIGSIG